jgi:GTPase subunit of restriction endonuclease
MVNSIDETQNNVNLEEEFKKWMCLQEKQGGGEYQDYTVRAYVYALKSDCKKLSNLSVKNDNLFYETSAKNFSELQNAIRRNPNFDEINRKAGNGAFSAGMALYGQFLNEREQNEIHQNCEDNHGSMTATTSQSTLIDGGKLRIWKVSHGNNGSFTNEERQKYLDQQVIVVHESTGRSQGSSFVREAQIGDYFYLCFGNLGIQLLGRILGESVPCDSKDDGWMQRNYEIIQESTKQNIPYADIIKGWTPNYNSTFTMVPKDDFNLFEEKILIPYFDLHISDLQLATGTPNLSNSAINYWWLNASPKMWSFDSIKIGDQIDYTSVNENGNRRKIYQNFENAQVGDIVIGYESNPVKAIVCICRIAKSHDGERIWVEKLENLVTPIEYASLWDIPELRNMQYFHTPRGSLFKLTKEEYDTLMELIREQNPVTNPTDKQKTYTKSDFLSEVFINSENYDTLKALLLRKRNIILQGAPGVGKTFAAKRFAWSFIGEQDDTRIQFVQFHQSYSYEDFVMGYRPDENGFSLKYGVFYKFCKVAENNPDKPYFFIIDEINRGNLSKIFGELLMLIECDKREQKVTLTYSETPFSVPKNLYIIGMMNTADRSLAMIDYALRRRFCFFELEPAFTQQNFHIYLKQNGVSDALCEKIISRMSALNSEIASDPNLGKGFRIGHSYFCGCKDSSEDWYKDIIQYEVAPLLQEYWFDDTEKAENLIGSLME